MITSQSLHELYSHIHSLKRLKRAGWVIKKVDEPESVGDHSFGLTILTMHFAKEMNLNVEKALIIAAVHDIGESVIGDITPHERIDHKDKQKREQAAVRSILKDDYFYNLWLDFEYERTSEGRLIKQLDKLEAYMQGLYYGISDDAKAEFYKSTSKAINDPAVRKVFEELDKADRCIA